MAVVYTSFEFRMPKVLTSHRSSFAENSSECQVNSSSSNDPSNSSTAEKGNICRCWMDQTAACSPSLVNFNCFWMRNNALLWMDITSSPTGISCRFEKIIAGGNFTEKTLAVRVSTTVPGRNCSNAQCSLNRTVLIAVQSGSRRTAPHPDKFLRKIGFRPVPKRIE